MWGRLAIVILFVVAIAVWLAALWLLLTHKDPRFLQDWLFKLIGPL
jgi:hypothetical protein